MEIPYTLSSEISHISKQNTFKNQKFGRFDKEFTDKLVETRSIQLVELAHVDHEKVTIAVLQDLKYREVSYTQYVCHRSQ